MREATVNPFSQMNARALVTKGAQGCRIVQSGQSGMSSPHGVHHPLRNLRIGNRWLVATATVYSEELRPSVVRTLAPPFWSIKWSKEPSFFNNRTPRHVRKCSDNISCTGARPAIWDIMMRCVLHDRWTHRSMVSMPPLHPITSDRHSPKDQTRAFFDSKKRACRRIAQTMGKSSSARSGQGFEVKSGTHGKGVCNTRRPRAKASHWAGGHSHS